MCNKTVKSLAVFILLSAAFLTTVNVELIYRTAYPQHQKVLRGLPLNVTQTRPDRPPRLACDLNASSAILQTSRTVPPVYPCNGTGQTVNISGQFSRDALKSFCQTSGQELRAILPVYSAPDNYARRRAIRSTVGEQCRLYRCKLFFILGVSDKPLVNKAVQQEYDSDRDILIINKLDTYRDLNNKVVAMLDWLIAYCPQPKYVIHFIDDTYPILQSFMEQLDTIKYNKYMLGKLNFSPPVRSVDSKWYISEQEYPYSSYPTYTTGVAYAFLNSDCRLLREQVHNTEYNWVEDVWFTGFVAKAAGFKLTRFQKQCPDSVPKSLDPSSWKTFICLHRVSPEDYYRMFAIAAKAENKTEWDIY